MADFIYRGRSSDGQLVEGVLQGASRTAVLQQLKRKNITPTKVEPSTEKMGKQASNVELSQLLKTFTRKKISIDELIMFSRQMFALTRSGIPLLRALNGLAEATRSPILSEVLHDISDSLSQGTSLSSAFRAHPKVFNELFVSMIQMGETTGRLDEAFNQLISHLELEKDTRKKVVAATRYPIIVTGFIFVAIFVINLLVIPQFSTLFDRLGADLPLPTIMLMGTSNFMQAYWLAIIIGIGLAYIAFRYWKNTPNGHLKWDRFILRIPIVGGIIERVALGRFVRPFAMMLTAGVPLLQALTVTSRTVGNEHIGQGIVGMLNGIERGESLLSTAASSNMFNPLILQMIAVGEETGNVSALLVDIADFYDQEVEYDLKRLSESIEPIILVFMGAMVLVLALGVFLPMWDLSAAFN